MGIQMNIKNAEAVELAREIAGLTGESVTQVVVGALRDRKRLLTKDERMTRLQAFIAESGKLWGSHERNVDHTAFIYDNKTGLPL